MLEESHPVCVLQAKIKATKAPFKGKKDLGSHCLVPGVEKSPLTPGLRCGLGVCCLQLGLRWRCCSSEKGT